MDTTKTSYIKNRYGDLCTSRLSELDDNNNDIFTGVYTIRIRNNNNIKLSNGVYTNNLPASRLNNYDVISYDVEINGILYKDCPLIKTSSVFFKDSSFYFIGNPYLINTALELEHTAN
jgi:hypothetical protein